MIDTSLRQPMNQLQATTRRFALATLAPALLFGLALLVRVFRLGTQSLWLDEGGTWNEITTRSWASLVADLWSARSAYPLYHLLMKGWVALAGDSEWALRFPSAFAGAATVALVYLLGRRLGGTRYGLVAAALLIINPFALWTSQDAKAYSIVVALVAWSLLALLDALRAGGRRRWSIWVATVVLLLMTHRLTLLVVIGEVALLGWIGPLRGRWRRAAQLAPLALAAGLAYGLITGIEQDPDAPPVGVSAHPLWAAWQLAGRFALHRYADDHLGAKLLWLAVMLLGAWRFGQRGAWEVRNQKSEVRTEELGIRDQGNGGQGNGGSLPPTAYRLSPIAYHSFIIHHSSFIIICAGVLPLAIYLLALAFGAPIYEDRYVSFLLPVWALTVAAGVELLARRWLIVAGVAVLLATQIIALTAQPYGLWSGNAVKENYRGAMGALAQRLTPGDAVVVHPSYIAPLYRYYAPRVSPDPLPAPLDFGRVGAKGYNWGEFDNDYSALLAGHRRAWLMIAPLNARTIDPPDPQYPQDDMGRVGINFLTADRNQKWRCTDVPYLDWGAVRLLCQSFPAPLKAGSLQMQGAWPIQASGTATFGDALDLLGYEFVPWHIDNAARAGGTLPLHVTWRTDAPLPTDYRFFVHLVPQIGAPVAAQLDSAPLYGGLPTSHWPVDQPIHDEVAVPLPADLAPGRYLVQLGWYDPTIADVESQRLPVVSADLPIESRSVVLGTVEVRQP